MQSVSSLILHPEYVSVFAGPTNVEDPVQLLMKDAGESMALLTLPGSVTTIIRHARCIKLLIWTHKKLSLILLTWVFYVQNKFVKFALLLKYSNYYPKQSKQMERKSRINLNLIKESC